MFKNKVILSIVGLACFVVPTWNATACYVCLGDPDAPMSKGMTVGILSLLVVIGSVLIGVSSFFIYLVKRNNTTGSLTADSNNYLSHNNTDR